MTNRSAGRSASADHGRAPTRDRRLFRRCGATAFAVLVCLCAAGWTGRATAAQAQDAPPAMRDVASSGVPMPGWQPPARLRRKAQAGPAASVSTGAASASTARGRAPSALVRALRAALLVIVGLILVYTVRHYFFTLNRLFGGQRHPYVDIDVADWPSVTVLVAAHNEEAVIATSLAALLDVDYPADRLRIVPVNDRSTDRTRAIVDAVAERHPGRIAPFHRSEGKPGKPAALVDATEGETSDIIIVFDADYVPGRGLIKQLVAPFFDPEVGATMGRVVPLNTGSNLLTRLLDMERAGGYQVDQQARMNMRLVPQYGGTVGGVRRVALAAVGGWRDDALAEDTDLTYRLVLGGWTIAYQNRSECYEEVPEAWPVRVRQIMRWARGHNQAASRYAGRLLTSPGVTLRERVDGMLLLGVYAMSPLLLLGWALAITLFYLNADAWLSGAIALFALMSYSALGNFAAFFEIASAVYLDGSRARVKLLPLNYLGFLVSLLAISRATVAHVIDDRILKRKAVWHKTARYRVPPGDVA